MSAAAPAIWAMSGNRARIGNHRGQMMLSHRDRRAVDPVSGGAGEPVSKLAVTGQIVHQAAPQTNAQK